MRTCHAVLQVLPALRSFCVYAAIGITAVYFLQATFFVACFTIDQRRVESKRNAFICCWKMADWTPNKCSQTDLCQYFFRNVYSKILLLPAVKVLVLVLSFAFLAVSGWGLSNLRQEFRAVWFLPQNSYLFKFFMKQEEFFPSAGETGVIYFSNMSLYKELPQIEKMVQSLEDSEYIGEVTSWYSDYKQYFEKQGYLVPDPDMTEDLFQEDLNMFLYSPSGAQYRDKNFKFASVVECNAAAPEVITSSIEFRYKKFYNTRTKISAMHSIKGFVANSNITDGEVLVFARIHSGWETDEIIEKELYRNMLLALLVVFLMTFGLMASMLQSLLVLFCVVMTLVDVGALMHWWGLTIDTVSCIDLVLAIGLCVDYAAHVGE